MATGDSLDYSDVYGQVYPYVPFLAWAGAYPQKQAMHITAVILNYEYFYVLTGLLRIFLHYIGVPRTNKVKKAYDRFFAVIFFVQLVMLFTWVGASLAWRVLAAILEPEMF